MSSKISLGLFARVMALPDAAREDLLEFLGASPVDDACLDKLIDEVAERVEASRKKQLEPN